jgi:hypothetical protein
VITEEQTDDVSGSELEDYSIWDGDFVMISTEGSFSVTEYDPVSPYVAPVDDTTVTDTTVAVVDASIAASDILYWVGEGSNEVILAVNWVDTALAWGYRWNGDATVSSMMTAICRTSCNMSGRSRYSVMIRIIIDSTTAIPLPQ